MKFIVKSRLKYSLVFAVAFFLWSCSAEAPVRTAQYAVTGLFSAALSDDGKYSLVGSINHGGSFWQNSTKKRLFNWNHVKGDFTPIVSSDIDSSSAFAATGSARTLVLWNILTGKPDGYWTTPGDIQSLKLTENGDYAFVGLDDNTARFFDIKNGGIKQTFRASAPVRAVDITADSSLGITGDDDYKVILWDVRTGDKKFEWTLSNSIASVALSSDGKYAFAAAQLGNAKIWSTRTGKEITSIDTGSLEYRKTTISQAVFGKDNRSILIGEINRRVSLVQLSTGIVQKEWDLYRDTGRPSSASVMALAFGSDNRYYAIASNGYFNVLE